MLPAPRTLLATVALAACSFDSTGLMTEAQPPGTTSTTTEDTGTTQPTVDPPPPPTTETSTGDPGPTTEFTTDPAITGTTPDPTTEDPTDTTGPGPTTDPPACDEDGVADPGEACDGADLAGQTCVDLGHGDGELACVACEFDVSGCAPAASCNDGVLDPGEECDGEEFGTLTCVSLGFGEGKLGCTMQCTPDTGMCPPPETDWYDEQYKKRLKFTVPAGKPAEDLQDFPIPVILTDMALISSIGDLNKVAFADAGETLLRHEVELSDPARLVFWVRMKALDADADNVFYLYFAADDPPAPANAKDTWSDKFVGVYHLVEQATNDQFSTVHRDSSESGHDGQQGGNEIRKTECLIGWCQRVGQLDYIELANPNGIELHNVDVTVTMWVRLLAQGETRALFQRSKPEMFEDTSMIVGWNNTANQVGFQHAQVLLGGGPNVADDKWHHVAWTQDKDADGNQERWRVLVDGVEVAEGQAETLDGPGHKVRIGGGTTGSGFVRGPGGILDEFQIHDTLRSDGWLTTAFRSQGDPATFVLTGTVEDL